MKKKLLIIFLFLSAQKYSVAQTDTAFWFAAPDIVEMNHPLYGYYDRPIYLRITSFTAAANVTISIPANPSFTPINVNIAANSTTTVDLTTWVNLIENFEPDNINNKGIYIRSTADITVYYEVNSTTCNCNPELFALKGKNALGNEFYIPSQLNWAVDTPRHAAARAGFTLVATQNNTTITITPAKPLINRPANVPFTITLNKGQSYACIALYRNGPNMLNGSKLVSDKPVSVTTYEDVLFSDGACADLAGDQLIPTSIFGTSFAIVRGDLSTRDKVVVTASQNTTNIYLNGSGTAAATINAGQSYEYDLTPAAPTLYVQTDKAASVYHYTGTGCEVGAAVIPKLSCTGSSSVSLVRSSNGGNASVMLVTKNGNQGGFLVNGVAGIITASDFSPIAGTAGVYVYAKKDVTASMALNVATTFSNSIGKFQLGFFNVTASNGGCMYGFFSDFKKSNVTSSQLEMCRFDSVQLNAVGGIIYQWTPVTGLSNPNISNPKASPAVTTDYKVIITDVEGCIDSAFVRVIVNNCSLTCDNWLYTPSYQSYVSVGDLDITGNQITVEAVFNRTQSYLPGTGNNTEGDLVAKHNDPTDANYILRPNHAWITTTNGFFGTPDICPIGLNKTYHVAMVYDGVTLKFYRNGFLMSQVPATGNLIQNNFNTRIGLYDANVWSTQFLGYTNEVRIWNTARTQAQIQATMNSSLPNPTTQTGLQAYYTFENLLNKQGNPAWNGTLGGSASINATNTSCNFVADSCAVLPCSNWLNTPTDPSYVTVGDLDITGNQLTVEANFNRTVPVNPALGFGFLVSKHTAPGNLNYALWPNGCGITTATSGDHLLFENCPAQINKTYHVAMVYDGVTLKFYRNGYLHSQVAATGNLINNDFLTTIAQNPVVGATPLYPFLGYINEVRIWNVARSQSQIQTYMNTTLPGPTTQSGLVAYYVFDNLLNKQGNPAWNGTITGSATVNATNTSCTFVADTCQVVQNISGIINTYTPVLALNPCDNKITVEDATTFNTGDTVLLIQMKGAVIDSTNTAAFGTITDYKNSGNYEFNYVKSKTGNVIELLNTITRQYDLPGGKVQLVRVPYYQNATITSTLTCLPWDGSKGGVLVLNAQDSVILNANIDVSGKGFRGGIDPFSNPATFNCYENQFYYPVNPDLASGKGEGIAEVSASKSFGKGALANGGGGGNSHNSGGGGGANAAAGGFGGYNFEGSPCNGTVPFDNRGIGGKTLTYSNAANKIFLGGGGGAGHSNNPEAFQSTGGNGSGIVIIIADKLKANTNKILANGSNAAICAGTGSGCHEGMGGGGAAGTTLLKINNYIDPTVVEIKGGNGGNMTAAGFFKVGPGGGGGGGKTWLTNPSLPAVVTVTVSGGQAGVCTAYGNDPWGATPGQLGSTLFNLSIPVDIIPFKPNIDSVRIRDSATSCNSFDFKGFGYTNMNPISGWEWFFGDGGTANTQNTSHTYASNGTFTVKLIVTDINGCKDSITKNVITNCLNPIGNIINTYTPVLAIDICLNKITVEDAGTFNTGDTVLMIQMKGAVIDSTNTAAFGTITDYKNAGNYEFNYVKSKTGNVIELLNTITRQYDIPAGKVQLIRVPYYQDVTVTSTLSCLPWDGSKGGVLVLNVQDTVNLAADINVGGKGFRGGNSPNTGSTTLYCFYNNYYYAAGNLGAAAKGESISVIGNPIAWGKGSPSNGGGGGSGHNSGGGGGANGSAGGLGGYQLLECGSSPYDNRGIGGHALTYSNALRRIYMGGGGGSGHVDNAGGSNMEGGNGGGIIIIRSNIINPNGFKISSNGDNARQCNFSNFSDCHDGSGGGGAGGTILIENNNYSSTTQIDAKGGKGGDLIIYNPPAGAGKIGPGGGGSGGVIWFNSASNPANTISGLNFGANGVIIPNANDPWGATPGQLGSTLFNLSLPVDNIPFKTNIDSVRIRDSATACKSFDFKGFGYTNTNPVASWQWYFGDGGTANTQNTSHTYLSAGAFTVKLVITDINGCKDSITKTVNPIALNFDFNYQFNACNPLSVQFNGVGTDTQNPYWSFGDGGTLTGSINPSHTYASQGTYIVKYSVGNGVCIDTLTKTIDLTVIQADIILTTDTTICLGATKQLLTSPALSFCWSPVTYLNNPNSPTPITSTPQSITYYYTAVITGTNLVNNGNFSAGNTGFTSQYFYTPNNTTDGEYFVGPNPQAWYFAHFPCGDHTTGNGNMMMVNGSTIPNVEVWKTNVSVTPNTNYSFSTWICSISNPNPAQLSFSINGTRIGSLITATVPPCNWVQFYTTWNSGIATTATISILNQNTIFSGNDFALDDISFAPVTIKRDSVKITVDTASVVTNPNTTICEGLTVQLNTTGGSTYSWSPATGLSNPNISNPLASPAVTTQYIVTGTTVNGCIAKDTVVITVNPVPVITTSNDTTICNTGSAQLFASGGSGYSWSPAATLNNPSIPNPVATPASNTIYYVTVTGANSCTKMDSVKIDVRTASSFSINPPVNVCKGSSIQLNASGGDLYSWTPAGSLNNAAIPNPMATPAATTIYFVQITDTLCNNTGSLTTTVTALPLPVLTTTRSNDIDCILLQSQLSATGANLYSWSPAASLNNPNLANPLATPTVTTQYIVAGTDLSGCTNTGTVLVKVSAANTGGYLMPTAFTPDNDGKNDCYGIKFWGTILDLQFGIYNRWGERIFYTTNPGACWDGTINGVKQDPAVFIYMIKAKTTCQPEVFKKGTFVLIR